MKNITIDSKLLDSLINFNLNFNMIIDFSSNKYLSIDLFKSSKRK